MRIEENRVFLFTFDTGEMGNIAIPVRGESREDAASRLQGMFGRMQTELAMEFPKVSSAAIGIGATIAPGSVIPMPDDAVFAPGGIPTEVLELRIDTLMETLGAKELQPAAKATTIKNWTGHDFVPVNYPQIVNELELIASGAKDVPVKSKKK